jgi:hypothetical protein
MELIAMEHCHGMITKNSLKKEEMGHSYGAALSLHIK